MKFERGMSKNNFQLIFLAFFVLLIFLVTTGTVSNSYAESCVTETCHSGMTEFETVHAPVKEMDCLGCHERRTTLHPGKSEKPSFALIEEGAALCYQCHDNLSRGRGVHMPVREGECLSCHRPHGSSFPFLLEVGENQRDLCFECHDRDTFEQGVGHGPVSLGVCTYCHDPHRSKNKGLLREQSQDLCLGCHAEFEEGMKKATVVHSAVKRQKCTACHLPHNGPEPHLLKVQSNRLCFGCHDEIEHKVRKAKTKHTALYKENKCGNCHLVHFSEHEHLLLRGEMELCLGCHSKDDHSKTNALRNIKKELEGKKYLHGPLEDNQCSLCHDPHGATYPKLMRSSYPGEFYAPYRKGTYGFCFDCHEDQMLRNEHTTKYTNFRNGDLNLHFLHVANQRKGRTCKACHEPHASNGEKLISKKGALFGSWRVPIRFSITETGGSCMPGCHRKVRYDRKKSVDYDAESDPS